MQNKIIAVICVLLLLVTLFAACGKKVIIQGKNGQEYVAMTDEEGNTVLNQSGEIVVYVTDDRGKYVTDANGERQTNAVTFPDVAIGKDKIETADYVLAIPNGWTAGEAGLIEKATEDAAVFANAEVNCLGKLPEGKNFDLFIAEQIATLEGLIAAMRESGAEVNYVKNESQVLGERASVITMVAQSEEIGVVTYKMMHFVKDGKVFKVLYRGNDQTTDTAFDIIAFTEQNLTVR